jgi:4-hydroxybenzoate polyprenyltransferase/phosphoglycolate phosphatase-like HAD superfamily hydrolase
VSDVTISTALVVDLDGTLVRTDTLWEHFFVVVRERPLILFALLLALLGGRAAFKKKLLLLREPDLDEILFDQDLILFLKQQKEIGRRLVLATASDQRMADAVADRLGLFEEVIASDGVHNFKGKQKAQVLIGRFGDRGFDYIGDSRADFSVWRHARIAYVMGHQKIVDLVKRFAQVEEIPGIRERQKPFGLIMRALRPHQWVKNLLLFLPLVAAHLASNSAALVAVTFAFVAFSLTASAVYLLNDLLDLAADRQHPTKCKRPFASGALPLWWGILLAPALIIVAASLSALVLPAIFTWVLASYFLLTTAYSISLKRKPVVDVILLAALYTVRVIAGAAAIAIVPSFWLLAFSMFIFLSLALAKRYTELDGIRERGEFTAAGRGWHVNDLSLIQTLGTGAGLGSVLVMALYINSPQAQKLYAISEILWLVCPLLLYWIVRLWFKTHRGEMHDDPVVFAIRDRVSLITGVITAAIVLAATMGSSP